MVLWHKVFWEYFINAFIMLVATPPKAIVFGSGYVTIPQMARADLWLNLVTVVIVSLFAFLLF